MMITVNILDEAAPPALVFDDDLWPRERCNPARLTEFEELYRDSGPTALPPLLVIGPDDHGDYVLLDGRHRVESAIRAGLITLLAEIWDGDPKDAFLKAVELSSVASFPMTREEKRAAVDRILAEWPSLSDNEIARRAGVSQPFVSKRRRGDRSDDDPKETPAQESEPGRDAAKLLRSFVRLCDDATERKAIELLANAAASQFEDAPDEWLLQLSGYAASAAELLLR